MNKKVRRSILIILLFVFIIAGTSIVLYGQGWRFDFTKFHVERVGAIFVRSSPAQASIRIDAHLVQNDSWFFSKGTLINNLFPKQYAVELSYPHYQTWRMHVSVAPMIVSEVNHAVLIPEDTILVASHTLGFWLVGDQLLRKDEKGLTLNDNTISGQNVIAVVAKNGSTLITRTQSNTYLVNQDGTPINITPVIRTLPLSTQGDTTLLVNEGDPRSVLVKTGRQVFQIDALRGEATTLQKTVAGKNVGDSLASSLTYIAWTLYNPKHATSSLVLYNTLLSSPLSESPALDGATKKLLWNENGQLGMLQSDGGLYLYTISENTLERIASDVKDFEFSSDGAKVAALEHSSFEVLSLNNQEENYRRFNLPDVGAIQKVEWYRDNQHLFLYYPNALKFLDLDDKAVENIATVIDISNAEYDARQNVVYALQDSDVIEFQFPNG